MDYQKYRQPVRVSEHSFVESFEEFCLLNGGDIIDSARELRRYETGKQVWDMKCSIPGVGTYTISKKGKRKKFRIIDLAEEGIPLINPQDVNL